MLNEVQRESVARAAHEVNRAYCLAIGDDLQPPWDEAPDWQKNSAVAGLEAVINGASPEQTHDSWRQFKLKDGWKYGPVKDAEKKEHPCMLPYKQLPEEQRRKDALYIATVTAMIQALVPDFGE